MDFPAILILLEHISIEDLDEIVTDAWLAVAPPKLAKEFLPGRKVADGALRRFSSGGQRRQADGRDGHRPAGAGRYRPRRGEQFRQQRQPALHRERQGGDHERAIRSKLEDVFGFEITTFVRTAAQVRSLATEKPFGAIAAGHTHFALLPLTALTPAQKRTVEALSNEHDEVKVVGRDMHWLIRSKSTETTLGPKVWKQALPDNPTTARNVTMLAKLIDKL